MIKPIYLTKYATAVSTESIMVEGTNFPQRIHYMPDTYNGLKSGLKYPPHQTAEKVMTEEITDYLRQSDEKTAFIFAAGSGSFAGLRNTLETWNPCNYRFFPLTLLQVYAGKTAQRFGNVELVVTDASACASSLKVLMDAQVLIHVYGFKRVVVLSVEDQTSEIVQRFFGEVRATITKEQEEAGLLPSAFDATNHSFNIGQGAVCAVFESRYQEGAVSMLGAYASGEQSDSALGQRPDGEGFYKAASKALELSGENEVKIVKTHGTGTASNNVAEKTAIQRLLGTKDYVATSYKPRIGHTLGASGLLESCLLFDDIRMRGMVPAIPNRTETDSVFLSHSVPAPKGDILSLAAGMGNIYAAAVWRM